MEFYKLKIKDKSLETADTMSLFFDIPDDLKSTFQFKPGQYLTLKTKINGEDVRRAYSICSAPQESSLGTSIKRLPGGLFSTFAHSNFNIGDVIEVAPPEGNFYVDIDPFKPKTYYFIAAGSGITPIRSMISEILEKEPLSMCYLVYGSKDEDNIIFREDFDAYERRYTDQIHVTYTLSKPAIVKEKGLMNIFKKGTTAWKGEKGRIDADKLKSFMSQCRPKHEDVLYYICGPGDMIESVSGVLKNLGIPEKSIKREFFSTKKEGTDTPKISGSKVKVFLDGEYIEFVSNGSKPILDELVALKKNPPYSCTSGACSSCLAKVTKGSAVMEVCYALDDDEIKDGYILTCQATPVTEELELTYQV
jgi:ring-1,2-phenylacetyl-CoA epoxidase subunit PaaE